MDICLNSYHSATWQGFCRTMTASPTCQTLRMDTGLDSLQNEASLTCPKCAGRMRSLILDGHYGRHVTLDHCEACKLFWFDTLEIAALSRKGLEALFGLIGKTPVADFTLEAAPCPRCGTTLDVCHDITRFGRMHYYRCPDGDGRAISHLQFLAEKGLLRKPASDEFSAPESHLLNAPCPYCGAALNVLDDGKCPFCASPVVVLDLRRALEALEVADAHLREQPDGMTGYLAPKPEMEP